LQLLPVRANLRLCRCVLTHFAGSLNDVRNAKATDFVVTEKIHGANMALCIDRAGVVRFGKRREWIDADDAFFGFRDISANLEECIQRLWTAMLQKHASCARLFVYGELFGGKYAHEAANHIQHEHEPVQAEIQYCADLRFCAFDVAVESDDGKLAFVDYIEAAPALDAAGFMWSRPLAICSFGEALDFPLDFQTTVPALLGLPPIADNWAEGVVIKPVHETTVPLKKGSTRALLKLKPARFAEAVTEHARAQASGGAGEADVRTEMLSFINANRLNAVVSKHGKPQKGAKGDALRATIRAEVVDDALTDALANDGRQARWSALTDAARARIQSAMADSAAALAL
jgi:Rnl2 family RNA ligase